LAIAKEDQQLGGSDGLAHMALCVVGNVNEQASQCGRQRFFADDPRGFKLGCGERKDAFSSVCERCSEFCEQFAAVCAGVQFCFQLS
jgi:hypothetical protein